MLQRDRVRLLGVRVDSLTWADFDRWAEQALSGNEANQVVTVNGEHILAANRDPKHQAAINQADLVVPDSTNVLWVSRVKGRGLAQKTAGVDLVLRLCDIAAKNGNSIFLLGSQPGVADHAAKKLKSWFPTLTIAGTSAADPNDDYALKSIKQSGADIVLVAYGAPAQEYWIAEHKNETGAKILVGVGGTFDILSGTLPRAPKFFRALQLEWLWRLILQPSRIKRIWNAVVVFPTKALFSK
ncbi:MAG TPA: WecB/TagA/CpsF family glycosyltransferase [Candidatus Saccharimonadales bacterium]|nr:WecB/TagA/CpsF family glycosyltransferase [Candidatus Saccharimonadales bacterium]